MTEGERIAAKFFDEAMFEATSQELAAYIDAALSAERKRAMGLVGALEKISELKIQAECIGGGGDDKGNIFSSKTTILDLPNSAADIAKQALADYEQKENVK